MADNSVLYGIIGALGLVVAGGGVYIAKEHGAFDPAPSTAAVTTPAPAPAPAPAAMAPPTPAPTPPPPPAPKPPVVAAPKPAPSPPPMPAGPTAAQAEQLRQLVLDARRAITRGDFGSADRALDQAERIDPRYADVISARRDLHDLQQRAQREGQRVDALVADARSAIARRDYVTADRLLDQAERMNSRDRGVQQARTEFNAAQQQPTRDSNLRIDRLVAQARTAIAQRDYATADRLLDRAENIDARDRDVQQARAELNAAARPDPGPPRR